MNYVLNQDHSVTPIEDLAEWAIRFRDEMRRVAEDTIGPYWVSTVFLGHNHSFGFGGPPLLFETMVFKEHGLGEDANFGFDRYATWDEAVAGHACAVQEAQERVALVQEKP